MTGAFIEHVNLTVTDPKRSADLFKRLFGWHIRWQGPSLHNGHTIHVGNDKFYLALYAPAEGGEQRFPKGTPLQHVGIVVEDLDEAEERVFAAGLIPFSHGAYEPGRRFYFLDYDGIEFELVSYLPAKA